jgi:hypothetical protein
VKNTIYAIMHKIQTNKNKVENTQRKENEKAAAFARRVQNLANNTVPPPKRGFFGFRKKKPNTAEGNNNNNTLQSINTQQRPSLRVHELPTTSPVIEHMRKTNNNELKRTEQNFIEQTARFLNQTPPNNRRTAYIKEINGRLQYILQAFPMTSRSEAITNLMSRLENKKKKLTPAAGPSSRLQNNVPPSENKIASWKIQPLVF